MTKTTSRPAAIRLPVLILSTLMLFTGALAFFSARWYVTVYGRIGFDSVLYTLRSSLGGVQSGLIFQYLLTAALPAALLTAGGLYWMLRCWHPQPKPSKKSKAAKPTKKKNANYQTAPKTEAPSRGPKPPVICILAAVLLLVIAAFDVELVAYLVNQNRVSGLYETEYRDPSQVSIQFPEEKRNLVYIMLESMETTYMSQDLGGAMGENLIPELTALAADNLHFSLTDDDYSGYYTTKGATWTIGSMVAQTAGIPLKTPTEDVNKYGSSGEDFLPGVTTLTDILEEQGYYQALMVGSNATFGGRRPYFLQHGMDVIYDIHTAPDDGIIPEGYFVWWGMEDLYLFEYAKQELTDISSLNQPFAFTMLTVDTHHVGGYQCALCQESASGESYDQSISCSSRQVAEFVQWLQQQPFYENTTVIIVGDHESMDNSYIQRNVDEGYQRSLYNCILNAPLQPASTFREFAAIDLFPTTLAAMGCEIEGNRLGLGVNLFSRVPSLTERYGLEALNELLSQASHYYTENFF